MPFNVVSLLLVLIQFLHFGGAGITPDSHRKASLLVSRPHRIFRRAASASPLGYFESVEDTEEKESNSVAVKGVSLVTNRSATYKPFLSLVNRILLVCRARSGLDGSPLFLQYCNFRV